MKCVPILFRFCVDKLWMKCMDVKYVFRCEWETGMKYVLVFRSRVSKLWITECDIGPTSWMRNVNEINMTKVNVKYFFVTTNEWPTDRPTLRDMILGTLISFNLIQLEEILLSWRELRGLLIPPNWATKQISLLGTYRSHFSFMKFLTFAWRNQ